MFNYSINSNICNHNYKNQNQTRKNNLSFGKIYPEYLFIHLNGFGQDYNWANEMVKVIDESKSKIQNKLKFKDILNYIATEYNRFFTEKSFNEDFHPNLNGSPFGILRKNRKDSEFTIISTSNRYAAYFTRFKEFFAQYKGPIINSENKFFNSPCQRIKLKQSFRQNKKPVNLSEMEIVERSIVNDLMIPASDKVILSITPSYKSVKPTLKYIGDLYSEVIKIDKVKTKEQLAFCIKKIAEMQWYFAQSTPFLRGSAGIAEVFTKSLCESLGIQVSPWKKGVAPDLEAYVRNLDDYIKNYPTFFAKQPRIMNDA